MKIKIYTRFLNLTSFLLNISIKNNWWFAVKYLIEFRKKHIAKTLRNEIMFFS
jgi:hypothetical protein